MDAEQEPRGERAHAEPAPVPARPSQERTRSESEAQEGQGIDLRTHRLAQDGRRHQDGERHGVDHDAGETSRHRSTLSQLSHRRAEHVGRERRRAHGQQGDPKRDRTDRNEMHEVPEQRVQRLPRGV